MNVQEHEFEPVPGLPEALPAGERLLWQGAPRWTVLACEAFHVRKIAAYFAVLLVLRGVFAYGGGETAMASVVTALWLLPFAAAAVGLLCLVAWLSARTTLYTVTSRRVVMRVGIALPMTINLPFSRIDAAGLRQRSGGTGDIALALGGDDRLAWLHLWPHVRAWKLSKPEPTMRAVPDASRVASLLSEALSNALALDPAGSDLPAAAAPLSTPDRREPRHDGHGHAWSPAS